MKLHWLQHADISCTRLYAGDQLPSINDVDLLIVMGGPMGIFDYAEHPWLTAEKEFIESAIDAGKMIAGICLGAQLMADVLGAKVYPGPEKEIGWFPITRNEAAPKLIPEELIVFHWHGDTFEIPEGAIPLALSEPGINQGFVYNDKAIGLQFHMETTEASMNALLKNCGHELLDAPWIQSADKIREHSNHIPSINKAMKNLLDSLLSREHPAVECRKLRQQ